MDSLKGFNI